MLSSSLPTKLRALWHRLSPGRRELAPLPAAEPEVVEDPIPQPRIGIEVDNLLRALGADL